MLVSVITCSGRELVALDADPSWRLIDVLAAIPDQDRALDCSEHVFIGSTELRPSMTLSDIEVEDGSKMTLVKTPVHTVEELEHVVRIIFSKALAELDKIETHADLIFSLRTRYPEFPPSHEGERAWNFTRMLLNMCQNEFESLPELLDPTQQEKQKAKALALMRFIGNLFLRGMLAVKVIVEVVHDLIRVKPAPIEEHLIECACELMKVSMRPGRFSLNNTKRNKLVTGFSRRLIFIRLMNIKHETDPNTGKSVFSEAITSHIKDVIDMRGRNWQAKT
jgi:hypothetical protein